MSLPSDAPSVPPPSRSSSSSAPAPPSHALAKYRYNQALELEKQLRSLLQVKGPFEPSVRALQNSIREKYESVILEDHELAESHDVEQAIWRLHYKQIDEFRAKIKKINVAASVPIAPGSKSGAQRDSLHKILAAFKSFLAEATGFYHGLILKLRSKHGLPQDYSAFVGTQSAATAGDDNKRTAQLKRCQLSCHRCMIFLGDLARYKEVHGNVQDARSIDFSVAAGYYLQAASLWPSSGNPHNQLAVLATYVSDELLAVYRYFRSLAVETPFLTARDNLILLFEKNRLHYSQLQALKSVVPGGGSQVSGSSNASRGDRMLPVGSGTVKLAMKVVKTENADMNANPSMYAELRRHFQIRFVRMHGILFTRTSLETFPQVYSETLSDLEQLLAGDDSILEASLGTDYRSRKSMGNSGPSSVLQLVAILIFTVHNINWSADGTNHPTYAEILQRSDLFQHALTAAFECAGRLMHRCCQSKAPARSVLLPAVLAFMEWLAGRPEMAFGIDVDKDHGNARSSFWTECLAILNWCLRMGKGEGNKDIEFEVAFTLGSTGGIVENDQGVALWEDFELQGFSPLAPAQTGLDYSKGPFRDDTGSRQLKVRIKRLLAAGKAVANAAESTQKGIRYDEDLDIFIMAEEAQVEKKEEKYVGADIEGIVDILEGEEDHGLEARMVTTRSGHLSNNNHSSPEKAATSSNKVTDEEEDEEVIVFKPLSKERSPLPQASEPRYADNLVSNFTFSSMPTSEFSVQANAILHPNSNNPWPLDSLGDVQLGPAAGKLHGHIQRSQGPMQYSSGDASYLLDGGIFMSSSKNSPRELATPLPLISTSTAGLSTMSKPMVKDVSAPLSTLSVPGLNNFRNEVSLSRSSDLPMMTSSAISSGNWLDEHTAPPQYTSSSTDAWLQGQRRVFTGYPDKRVNTGGVLASQSQTDLRSLWTSDLETLDKSGPSTVGSSAISKDRINGEIAINSLSLNPPTMAETRGSFDSGKNSTVNNRDVTTTINNSWNEKEPSVAFRTINPAMRPPPGFGPLPVRPVVRPVLGTSQGIIQSPSAHQPTQNLNAGDDQLDDYSWLDGYRSVKPATSQAGYPGETEFPLSNNSHSMWSTSDGHSRSAGFESAPFPFPGMGALHHRRFHSPSPPHLQPQVSYMDNQHSYNEKQILNDDAQAQVKVQAELQQHQRQQLLLLERQQQQHQQQWPGQFHTRDPFVS